jgi:hypothetical protein
MPLVENIAGMETSLGQEVQQQYSSFAENGTELHVCRRRRISHACWWYDMSSYEK